MITLEVQHVDGSWHQVPGDFLDLVAAERRARSACIFWRVLEDGAVAVQGPVR